MITKLFLSPTRQGGGKQLPAEEFRPARDAFQLRFMIRQSIKSSERFTLIDVEVPQQGCRGLRGRCPTPLSVSFRLTKETCILVMAKGIGQNDWIKKETIRNYTDPDSSAALTKNARLIYLNHLPKRRTKNEPRLLCLVVTVGR